MSRPVLTPVPSTGDRVCLAGWPAFTDRHDHGTVIAARRGSLGSVMLMVEWDDDPSGDDKTGWCALTALDTRCPTRALPTPHELPKEVAR